MKLSVLLKSLRAILWRQSPVIYPERLKHSVDNDGRHHLELVLEASEVEDDLPRTNPRAAATGLSTAQFARSTEDDDC